jgi:hypothetical protein
MPDRPTRALSAVVSLLLLAAGCSPASLSPGASASAGPTATAVPTPTLEGAVSHPTDPLAIVLRVEEAGGFIIVDVAATRVPVFTLYGDGSVIYAPPLPPDAGIAAGPPLLRRAHMTEQQIGDLLRLALGPGRLQAARESYTDDRVIDATSTVFSIDAGGVTKTVDVYALSEVTPDGPDAVDRRGMAQLAARLRDFGAEVRAGRAEDAGPYQTELFRGVLIESGAAPGEARDWPWPDIAPEDFVEQPGIGFRTRTLSSAEARALADAPGGLFGVAVFGPDRTPYTIALRPLLPEEER